MREAGATTIPRWGMTKEIDLCRWNRVTPAKNPGIAD